jgi:hypothetical protein
VEFPGGIQRGTAGSAAQQSHSADDDEFLEQPVVLLILDFSPNRLAKLFLAETQLSAVARNGAKFFFFLNFALFTSACSSVQHAF